MKPLLVILAGAIAPGATEEQRTLCVTDRGFYFDTSCQRGEETNRAILRIRPSTGPKFPRASKASQDVKPPPAPGQDRKVIVPDAIRNEIQKIPPLNGVYDIAHTSDTDGRRATVEGKACLRNAPIRDFYPGAFELMNLARGSYSVPGICNVDNWTSSPGRISYRFSCTQNGQTASTAISISATPTQIRAETKAVTAVPSDYIRGNSDLIIRKVGTCK
ncbi:MAG: hypothetical protein HY322_17005 [Betaproteobacteria bacterium]|nr:hypothetical protein [Betaproteobacteria bacterium]